MSYLQTRIDNTNRLAGNSPTFRLSGALPAMTTAGDRAGGARVQRFRKDMIAVGEYRHPIDGYSFTVTPAKLSAWADAFNAMKANGVAVEVVKDHSLRADDVVGYLIDVFVEGDRLIGIHEMVGEQSIELAQRVRNVSLMIEPNVVDGRGNRYGQAIVHSAIVQRPVVPGQEPFRIAASSAHVPTVEASGAAYVAERRARVEAMS